MTRYEQLREQCARFHSQHPEVWELFAKFTFDLIHLGRKHYSADAVMHRVRWETDTKGGSAFKINNNFIAFYARRFMNMYPQHAGFFRTRPQSSQNHGAK